MANDQNYTLGRGKLYFGRFAPGTMTPRGERYFGNTPEVNYTAEAEMLDHYGSDEGIRELDASVPLQTNRTGNFTCDNIDLENCALFWFGDKLTVTTTAATGDTQTITVEPGLFYQLGASETVPTGARNVSNVAAEMDPGGTPVSLTAGEDFVVEEELGRITFLADGPNSVSENAEVQVTYDVAGSTQARVVSGNTPIEGALRYISYNPEGEQQDYYFPRVKISPNGDFALKGDDWQALPFNLQILKKPGMEAVYIDGRPQTS